MEEYNNYFCLVNDFLRIPFFLFYANFFAENTEILITGAEEVTCGETARFEADVKEAEPSSWSVTWQKVHGRKMTEEIDTGSEKYKGSSNRRLVINTVGKEDEGEYQAVLSRELNRRIFSNLIYLHPVGGTFLNYIKQRILKTI